MVLRMQPRIVSEIIEADGTKNIQQPQAVEQVVSENSTKIINSILQEVFKSNLIEWNYKHLRSDPIAMKSGTGLIVRDGVYSRDSQRYLRWGSICQIASGF